MGKVIDLDEKDRLEYEEEASHYRLSRSKSSVKKDVYEITDFGRLLVELNDKQLNSIPLTETIKTNVIDARTMQKIALKRQIQFIGKLLRKVDNIEEVQKAYDVATNNDKEANLLLQRIENIRDNLVNLEKAKVALDKLIAEQPSVDVQKLRQLIRNHNKEVEKDKPRKSFKEIFQLLRAVYKS
ncbi:ribosome biogenesis factor YjgA [Francisellaceae bacterium CB300]